MQPDVVDQNCDSDVLTPTEAARLLRISRSALYELVRRHDLPHVRLSARCIRLSRESLTRWLREREKGGAR